jgi:tetratricopeptide (TPR) repeat protein
VTGAEAHWDEGNSALALGDLETAVVCYRKAVEADPEYFDAWHALGMALMKLKRYPEAIEAGKVAVRLRPNDLMAYTSLSLAYVRNGDIKKAEEMGAKARILSWGGKVAPENKVD